MRTPRWSSLVLAATLVAFGIGGKEAGNRLYRAGKYAEAAAAYAKALKDGDDSPSLHYDYGTALLRLGRYGEAEQQFRAALKDVDPALRQRTLYNLGNRYLYAARAQQSAVQPGAAPVPSSEATKETLDAAVKSYQQALRVDPRDAWAKWNLELALKQQKKQQGGGGGRQQNKGGGGGGGQQSPQPQPQGGQSGAQSRSQMSQAQADRILSAAENDERQLYKDKVRKGNREVPVTQDW